MELEVGMYVRGSYYSYRGKIGKIIKNYNNDLEIAYANGVLKTTIGSFLCDNTDINGRQYVASFDITDLIKAGDIVAFKNDEDVYRVSCVPNEESACDCFYLVFNYATQYGLEDIEVSKETMQNTLESIITREQFEQIAYKVGD